MGVYFKAKKQHKKGKFPESRTQSAGDSLNRKIAVRPSERHDYSLTV